MRGAPKADNEAREKGRWLLGKTRRRRPPSSLDHQLGRQNVDDHASSHFDPFFFKKTSQPTENNVSPLKRNTGREGGPKATNSEDITRATMEPCQPDAPLYSSRIIATFVKFIERYYDHIDINELLYYAKMEPYQVKDEDYWFNQEQVRSLSRKTGSAHEESKCCAGSRQVCGINRLSGGREELCTRLRESREGL